MCSFLTVGVDEKRSTPLESALIALALGVSRDVNPHVARLFPKGQMLFRVTRGECSCDLVPLKADTAREEKRRRRGLSGSRRPHQISESLFATLHSHAPVSLFFHEVEPADELTAEVPTGAQATLL